jgi:hypothetical protein
MKDGSVRLFEILLQEFIAEMNAEKKCTCSECLGWQIRNWFYLRHGVRIA